MSEVPVTTEQVHELIQQLAAMNVAASITPQIVANIFEKMRNLNDQEREKVIAVAEAYIAEIENTGVPAEKVSYEDGNLKECLDIIKMSISKASSVGSASNESDLDLIDESGNVLARYSGGHIKTKNFDSANVPNKDVATTSKKGLMSATDKSKLDSVQANAEPNNMKTFSSQNADFDVSDENGKVILRCKNGHIKTKNFDSSNIGQVQKINGENILIL